jgi:hypothetical protein
LNKALVEGKKMTLVEFLEEHGDDYTNLSSEERARLTQRLLLTREEKLSSLESTVRKLSRGATGDITASIKSMVDSCLYLPERAGYAVLAFGARCDFGGTAEPFDMVPAVLSGFCEKVLGKTPLRIAQEMEAWILSNGASAEVARDGNSSDIRSEVTDRLRKSFGKCL